MCTAVLNSPYPPGILSFSQYLQAFLLTLLLEVAVGIVFLQGPLKKKLLAIFLANLATHPAAIYLWIPFASNRLEFSIREIILSAELVIPFVEYFIYRQFSLGTKLRTFSTSWLCNFVSWAVVAWI